MKKFFALLFSFALAFTFPTVAFADEDKDCSDFATWKEAQQYFESKGGSSTNNVDRLDNDGDGIVCENLKGYDPNHKNPNNDGNSGDTGNDDSSNDDGTNNDGSNSGGSDDEGSTNPGGSDNNNSNNTNKGGKMPKTATSYPTGLLAGAVLLLMGAGLFALKPLFGRK